MTVLGQKQSQNKHFLHFCLRLVGRDSSVGMATRYELDGPGTESRCVRDLYVLFQKCPGAHPASYVMGTEFFPGVKRGAWRWSPTPSSAEVKERVELYLYSTSGPSWPVTGWTVLYWLLGVNLFIVPHFTVDKLWCGSDILQECRLARWQYCNSVLSVVCRLARWQYCNTVLSLVSVPHTHTHTHTHESTVFGCADERWIYPLLWLGAQ